MAPPVSRNATAAAIPPVVCSEVTERPSASSRRPLGGVCSRPVGRGNARPTTPSQSGDPGLSTSGQGPRFGGKEVCHRADAICLRRYAAELNCSAAGAAGPRPKLQHRHFRNEVVSAGLVARLGGSNDGGWFVPLRDGRPPLPVHQPGLHIRPQRLVRRSRFRSGRKGRDRVPFDSHPLDHRRRRDSRV
jgi:hypothetical protein